MAIMGTYQCTSLTPALTVFCSKNDAELLIYVRLFLPQNTTIAQLNFSISGLQSAWYAQAASIVVQTTDDQPDGLYFVEQAELDIESTPATLSVTATSDDGIILLGQSTVQLAIQAPFVLNRTPDSSKVTLQVIAPSDHLTPLASTCAVSLAGTACSLSGQTFTVSGLNSFSNSLTLTFSASTGYFAVVSSNFTATLSYDGVTVAFSSSGRLHTFCANPCKQCQTTASKCLSCLPTPYAPLNNTLFPSNQTCLQNCPITYYQAQDSAVNNLYICLACNSSACYSCVETANKCTGCSAPTFLHQSACLQECPSTYYGDPASNSCKTCKSPCLTCNSLLLCSSCLTGYLLDIDSICRLTCSLPNYIGVNNLCQKCTSNCATCSASLSNCTACLSPFLYIQSNHTCVAACPPRYFSNAGLTCDLCEPPCLTCLSVSRCLSCVSAYYLYDNSSCTQNCPNGTLATVDTCQLCSPTCATCANSIATCTSCSSPLIFYQNQCLTDCPALTYPYNQTCTTCIDPCVTCAASPSLCLSCTPGKFLLANSCVDVCPLNGYYLSGATCLTCSQNCLFCKSVAECTMCSENYYILHGVCVSECPPQSPIVEDQTCTPCGPQCATCSGSADECITCTIYYFRYQYTCVQECPLAYYSNVLTYECEDALTTRITFFPILIITFIVTVIVLVSKCFTPSTALPTSLTALYSPLELAIWIYILTLMYRAIKEPGVNYTIPAVFLILAITLFFVSSIAFHFLNKPRVQDDEYAKQWSTSNVNYNSLQAVSYVSLPFGCKFFRIVYSRLFNAMPLSLAFKNHSNIFTMATVFTLVQLMCCEVLAIVACWALIYNKSLKDQIFYSSL